MTKRIFAAEPFTGCAATKASSFQTRLNAATSRWVCASRAAAASQPTPDFVVRTSLRGIPPSGCIQTSAVRILRPNKYDGLKANNCADTSATPTRDELNSPNNPTKPVRSIRHPLLGRYDSDVSRRHGRVIRCRMKPAGCDCPKRVKPSQLNPEHAVLRTTIAPHCTPATATQASRRRGGHEKQQKNRVPLGRIGAAIRARFSLA